MAAEEALRPPTVPGAPDGFDTGASQKFSSLAVHFYHWHPRWRQEQPAAETNAEFGAAGTWKAGRWYGRWSA